jgi:pullulanase
MKSSQLLKILILPFMLATSIMKSQPVTVSSLDSIRSDKVLGCITGPSSTSFRLFAPRATDVRLVVFEKFDDGIGQEFAMTRDTDGVWEYTSGSSLTGKYYGYRVNGPSGKGEMFNPRIVIADPYSRAVATKNNYHHAAKSLILDQQFDWEGDTWVVPPDHDKLVIYEAHIRDLTAHPSSGVRQRGTYLGLTETGCTGGLSYLKDLGINAVEFLPLQKFGNIETPYRDANHLSDTGEVNTWNPYERNHWGYMTSYFFAPETYYATDGTMEREQYNGKDARAVNEFRTLVKTLHSKKIAVLMDVVYNHVSQYDYNPFKYIDRYYYFRTDTSGNFTQGSGCGNDFNTDRPMARRLIVESIKYWMTEYHIDGFRFDLATMIDWETCREIAAEAKKINPNVILIAEAWGGGKYDPPGFSDIGWAAWNDQIRNGVKGQNPHDGLGFIFGKFQGGNSKKSFQSFITGTLRANGGMYVKKEHSINYLESHDDNTLGDFIRFGTGEVSQGQKIADRLANARISPRQMTLNKLAALYLFVSQGPVMIHEGQEYARSKVIAPTDVPDTNVGRIDANSYNKDNETNYLNYNHKSFNQELYDYYKGLIALRAKYPVLNNVPADSVRFLPTKDDFLIAFRLPSVQKGKAAGSIVVILNGNQTETARFTLPTGKWGIVADAKRVNAVKPLRMVTTTAVVPPCSGMILVEQ